MYLHIYIYLSCMHIVFTHMALLESRLCGLKTSLCIHVSLSCAHILALLAWHILCAMVLVVFVLHRTSQFPHTWLQWTNTFAVWSPICSQLASPHNVCWVSYVWWLHIILWKQCTKFDQTFRFLGNLLHHHCIDEHTTHTVHRGPLIHPRARAISLGHGWAWVRLTTNPPNKQTNKPITQTSKHTKHIMLLTFPYFSLLFLPSPDFSLFSSLLLLLLASPTSHCFSFLLLISACLSLFLIASPCFS